MKKGDRSLYYHEDVYQRTGDEDCLCFSTSSSEDEGPTSPGAASPEPSEQEAMNVEDWLCFEASGGSSLQMSGGCNAPRHTECPAPRTWLSVFQASLPARRSTGCRWALTGEFLHAMALRMPLLRAAAALGMSAAALVPQGGDAELGPPAPRAGRKGGGHRGLEGQHASHYVPAQRPAEAGLQALRRRAAGPVALIPSWRRGEGKGQCGREKATRMNIGRNKTTCL
jgi:hypothetical protein